MFIVFVLFFICFACFDFCDLCQESQDNPRIWEIPGKTHRAQSQWYSRAHSRVSKRERQIRQTLEKFMYRLPVFFLPGLHADMLLSPTVKYINICVVFLSREAHLSGT